MLPPFATRQPLGARLSVRELLMSGLGAPRALPQRTAALAVYITVTVGVISAVAFVTLRWSVRSGTLSNPTALTFFGLVSLAVWTTAIWTFLRRGVPPIEEQTGKLVAALERAQTETRRQYEFLTHVHHELRTPLTKLVGATETLRHRGDALEDDERHLIREMAYTSALELHMVVESLAVSVEHALPGLDSGVPVDNWSSQHRSVDPFSIRRTAADGRSARSS